MFPEELEKSPAAVIRYIVNQFLRIPLTRQIYSLQQNNRWAKSSLCLGVEIELTWSYMILR